MRLSKRREKERFKKLFQSELLEYHFEQSVGKNEHNSLPWRRIVEDSIQPHVDILCYFSKWLIKQGWSKAVVEELFFVVADDEKRDQPVRRRFIEGGDFNKNGGGKK